MEALDGRVVLVTGAAGGIGSATARAIVRGGGRAVIHDIDERALDALVLELGAGAAGILADLADPAQVEDLWDRAQKPFGPVDVLVNNAAVSQPVTLDDDLADWVSTWTSALSVNLMAPSILCRGAVKDFSRSERGGVIVNVASVTAFRGALPQYWHYGAAKGGLVSMTRTIARQYGRDGVTAFVVAPGRVDTAMSDGTTAVTGLAGVLDSGGLNQVADPEDVAHIIAFLASGRARHATGSTIDINGAGYVH